MSKTAYIEFCENNKAVSLFMRPYWLDAVAGNSWDAILANDSDGEVLGAWAFYKKRILGSNAIAMPYLTPYTGIYLKENPQLPPQKRQLQRQEILENLISKLPDVTYFEQKLQYTLNDWAPFYWAGYREKTHYTFRFDNPDPEGIYGNFSVNFKRNLRAAERIFDIDETDNTAGLHALIQNVFEHQKQAAPFSEIKMNKILTSVFARNQCSVYRANQDGLLAAALVVVWDDDTTYCLLNGRNFNQKGHAINLLMWQAIRDAARRDHHFDFEGSMMKGVHRFFRSFGGKLIPYHFIYRYKGLARIKNLI